jgi:hypothetical protein
MQPKIHYAEDDCPVAAPDGFPKDDELQFEIEMLDFFKAKVILIIAWIDYKNIMLYTKSNTVKVSIQDSGQGSRISNVVVCVLYHFLFYVLLI